MVDWVAYYTNDREFESSDVEWSDLPDDGVLAISLYHETDHQSLYEFDWYFYVPENDLFAASNDSVPEIKARYPGAICKRGMWAPYDEYKPVKRKAQRR